MNNIDVLLYYYVLYCRCIKQTAHKLRSLQQRDSVVRICSSFFSNQLVTEL